MANENLVSNVQYKGQVIGSATLVIEDTSALPVYSLSVFDVENRVDINPNNLLQLGQYRFQLLSQVGKVPTFDKVYVRITTPDGKMNAEGNMNPIFPNYVKDYVVDVNQENGNAFYTYHSNFFPSLLGYGGKVEFFHDAARTQLIGSFNVSVKALISASLVVATETHFNGQDINRDIEMEDPIYIMVKAEGEIGQKSNVVTHAGFVGSIGMEAIFDGNPWLYPPVYNSTAISKQNGSISGFTKLESKMNPANPNPQMVSVYMGETAATNNLVPGAQYFGSPFMAVTEQTVRNFNFGSYYGHTACTEPFAVMGQSAKIHGSFGNTMTWFGKYRAVVKVLSVTTTVNNYASSNRIILEFRQPASPDIVDSSSTKPETIFLTVSGSRGRFVRLNVNGPTASRQEYFPASANEQTNMYLAFRRVQNAMVPYQISLV